jgi:hypothetical protein
VLVTRDGREHGFPFPVADGLLGAGGVAMHPHPGLAEDAATVAPWRLHVPLATSAMVALATAQLPTPGA